MKEAMLFVFATCSSVATIPLNLKCTKELGVSDKIADFVIPFGAVMNMNGTAIYEAVAVIFASQVFGIQLTLTQQIMVMVTAVLASVGTAGIPGSGPVSYTHLYPHGTDGKSQLPAAQISPFLRPVKFRAEGKSQDPPGGRTGSQ